MQIDTKVMDRAKGSLERSVKKSVSRIRTPILKICRPDNYNKVVLTDWPSWPSRKNSPRLTKSKEKSPFDSASVPLNPSLSANSASLIAIVLDTFASKWKFFPGSAPNASKTTPKAQSASFNAWQRWGNTHAYFDTAFVQYTPFDLFDLVSRSVPSQSIIAENIACNRRVHLKLQ